MKKIALSLACATLLAGCGTAGCNDSGVKDTVVELLLEDVGDAAWGREMIGSERARGFRVTDVKTVERDEELDTYTCEATLSFEFDGEEQTRAIEYDTAYLEDSNDTEITVYPDVVKSQLMMLAASGTR